MRRLAVLSFHTSPLLQPGLGDSGGMNVYVREMASALARIGIVCDVFTRRTSHLEPDLVEVEPNFRVHYVTAGPVTELPLSSLEAYIGAFTEGVLTAMTDQSGLPLDESQGGRYDAIHANYWLSAIAGHTLKHELGLPLISTFHTLDRVKAEADPETSPEAFMSRRATAEAQVIGCSDAVLASCDVEAEQLVELYGADPHRISIIPLGIEHAFFAPGNRDAARAAVKLPASVTLLLFAGRLQPLKRADIAVTTLAELTRRGEDCHLAIVGGPSGPHGDETLTSLRTLVQDLDLGSRVHFVDPQPHHLLSSYYRAADVVLVPSRSESFGLVALEAATCGIPVVASNVGGLSTLVLNGETGFLLDEPDPSLYATAVQEITDDASQATAFAAKAVDLAAPYTWRRAATTLAELATALVAKQLVEC